MVGTPVAGRNRARDRGADRLLRQHPGAARRPARATRRSASCWRGCARRRSAPTPTRTCRSSGWSRSCSRSATSSRTPLFQVDVRAAERAAAGRSRSPGLDAGDRWTSTSGTAKFDLTLSLVARTPAGSRAAASYSTDLFDAATAARLVGALRACCSTALAGGPRSGGSPSCRCSRAAERAAGPRRVERHRPSAVPARAGVHELFAAQAARDAGGGRRSVSATAAS